jgi:ketosteroid isomerase-like protein
MADPTSPEAVVGAFLAAFSRLDLDRMIDYFASDATMFGPFAADHHRLSGPEAIRRLFAAVIARVGAAGGSSLEINPEDQDVQLLGDGAVVTFHLPGPPLGRRTFVLRRSGDSWRIVHIHASSFSR